MNFKKFWRPDSYLRKISQLSLKLNHRLGREVVVTEMVEGMAIRFNTSNATEYEMRARASYTGEKGTLAWIDQYIQKDDIVYDIGANVGAYSLLMGKKIKAANGKGKVFAFEPESLNSASLNKNIVLNGLDSLVIPVPLAVGSSLKLGQFFLSKFVHGAATHGLDRPESDGKSFIPAHVQGIVVMSLDQLVMLEGIEFPNHIKIDVDGLEKEIVTHMGAVLKDRRLKTILIEVAEHLSQGFIEKTIESAGFRLENSESMGKGTRNLVYVRD